MMVRAVYAKTRDLSLLKRALPILLKEHAFWTSGEYNSPVTLNWRNWIGLWDVFFDSRVILDSEPHEVRVRDKRGEEHRLSRFWANWDTPRPESFTIVGLARSLFSQFTHHCISCLNLEFDNAAEWGL